jgi:hypothetical protein
MRVIEKSEKSCLASASLSTPNRLKRHDLFEGSGVICQKSAFPGAVIAIRQACDDRRTELEPFG